MTAAPVPSAKGTLAATPLAHALVYARNHRLTGAFDLIAGDGRRGVITMWRGRIIGVRTVPPVHYFGTVAYELGLIDGKTLDATLLQVAQEKRLHGEILVSRGLLTEAKRDDVLVEQFCRKVHHLFTFPTESTYAFYDAKPRVEEPPIVVDPLAPIWRGIRDFPPEKGVREVMSRIGGSTLRMVNEGAIDRARLPAEEAALCEVLSERPMTVAQMTMVTPLPRRRVELLAYLLVISKCVESTGGNRVHPSTGALPAAAPSRELQMNPSVPGMAAARSPAPSGTMPRVSVPPPTPAALGADAIALRAEKIESESYFEVLGVADGASSEAVRAAYMRLAKAWHPERIPAELAHVRIQATKIFLYMTRAQQTLCDPDARRSYLAARSSQKKLPRKDVLADVDKALAKGNWDAAREHALALAPDDAEGMAIAAWVEARGGLASEDVLKAALVKLDRAVNTDNSCVRAHYYRGQVNKRLGHEKNAFRDFTRALEADPAHTDAEREIRIFEMRARRAR